MTEEQALRQLKQGSQEALAWFIDRYGAYAAAIVRNVMGAYMTDADVEEAVSDVFLGFWNNAGQVRGGAVKAYLGAVARNSAKNKLRQACRTVPLPEDAVLVDPHTPESLLERRACGRPCWPWSRWTGRYSCGFTTTMRRSPRSRQPWS